MLVARCFEQDDLFCGVNNENSNSDAGNGKLLVGLKSRDESALFPAKCAKMLINIKN